MWELWRRKKRVLNEEKEKEATGKRLFAVNIYVCVRLTERKTSKSTLI